MLELKVRMININLPAGHRLLQDCLPLYEYSWFIERIRTYRQEGLDRDGAVTLAVKDSIRKGIFTDFVREHGTEVQNMLYTQFNMDDALEVRYEEGVEDGIEQGIERGRTQGARRLLVHLVCGKLQMGESPEKIAADLLTDREEIDRICEAYAECGPEEAAVLAKLEEQNGSGPMDEKE